jgi:hypothetical protein
MNDAAFDAPGPILDRTVHRLGLPTAEGERAILTVQRTAVGPRADVVELARNNARQAAVELAGHRVLSERRGSEGPVYTRQVHLVVKGTWLVFAASGDASTRAICDAAIERAVTTFRGRG